MEIKIKKLRENVKLPYHGSAQAAGYDLFANIKEPVEILPHEAGLLATGIAAAVPEGYFGGIFARSGLSLKEGLRPANCVGVVDSDYRGEIFVGLRNDSNETRTVTPGEKIAQLIVLPYLPLEFTLTDNLDETERGAGGFGSTGN